MDVALLFSIIFLGMTMGSFAGAQVWRLRAWQLRDDLRREAQLRKKKQRTVSEKEEYEVLRQENAAAKDERKKLSPLLEQKLRSDRSRCLSCGHELKWYDLVPIISWLSLSGKCRYCRTSIGWTELLLEVGLASLFTVSAYWWAPFDVLSGLQFALWLIALVLLAILFVYDARWFLLPNKINWAFIAVAAVSAGMSLYRSIDLLETTVSLVGAVSVLSGVYLVLYLASRGRWIGFGDVKLGLGLGLFLGDWLLALVALFLANFIGTMLVLPGMFRGTLKKEARIPFGPLLIVGFLIAWFMGDTILSWYMLLI